MPAPLRSATTTAITLLLLSAATAPLVNAQSGGSAERLSRPAEITRIEPQQGNRGATVGIVTELPDGTEGIALILRDPDVGDIILIRENATVAQLASAFAVLWQSRETDGAAVTELVRLAVKGEGVPPHWRGTVESGLNADLTRLRSAPPRALRHVGSVPAVFVTLAESSR